MRSQFRPLPILFVCAIAFLCVAASSRNAPQNGGIETCRVIPGANVTLTASPAATIGSCGMPCFGYDPGLSNTIIGPNGNNLVQYTWSSAPTSITTFFQSSCDGNLRQDNHTYTVNLGATGASLPVIGGIDFPTDPLAPWNSYCGTGCAIAVTATATGGTNVQVVKSAAGDTAIQYVAQSHTTQTQ